MIFVSLGTQDKPFNRIIDYVLSLKEEVKELEELEDELLEDELDELLELEEELELEDELLEDELELEEGPVVLGEVVVPVPESL